MAGARFDILFAGQLLAEASPDEVRRWFRQRFKLSDATVARLFDNRTHTIKRGVDAAAASRYREMFRDAGALVEIRALTTSSQSPPSRSDAPAPASVSIAPNGRTRSATSGPLPQEAAPGSDPSEGPPVDDPPQIDTSQLSLVPGQDWTLEDCQPRLPPVELPDTSHLELVTPAPDGDEERGN
jgi:hypothetical protein